MITTPITREQALAFLDQCGRFTYEEMAALLLSIYFYTDASDPDGGIAFKFKGLWSSDDATAGLYDTDTYVTYNNRVYRSVTNNNTITPGTNEAYWVMQSETILSDLNFKGTAVPADNPGTQTTPAFWIVSQAGTYTNFGGVVLAANSLGFISWNGTAWSIAALALDTTTITNNAIAAVLLALYTDNLIAKTFYTGSGGTGYSYYGQSAASIGAARTDSTVYASTQAINIPSTGKIYLGGLTDFTHNTLGKGVNSSNNFVKNFVSADFTTEVIDGKTYYVLSSFGSGATKFIITPKVIDIANFKIYANKPSYISKDYIRQNLSTYNNDLNFLTDITGVLKDDLFEGGGVIGTLIPYTYYAGYFGASAANLSTTLSTNPDYKSTHAINIPASGKVYIYGMTQVAHSALGKGIDASGNFVKNFVLADFSHQTIQGQSVYVLTSFGSGANRFLLTPKTPDFTTLALYDGPNQAGVTIKPELLPGDLGGSDSEAQALYLRGLNRAKYDTATYYGVFACGQSNQEGREAQSNLPVGYPSELTNVKLWDRTAGGTYTGAFANAKLGTNTGADTNTETRFGYDWIVYKKLADYLVNNIYVVKRTRGGSPLAKNPEANGITRTFHATFEDVLGSNTKITQQYEQVALNAFKYIAGNSLSIKFKCVLWLQGETDQILIEWQEAYYQNLKNWIGYARGIAQNPELKVIVVTTHLDNYYYSAIIREAQLRVGGRLFKYDSGTATLIEQAHTGEDKNVIVYNVDGRPFTTIGDDIHMDAAMCLLVGEDVFQIIKDF